LQAQQKIDFLEKEEALFKGGRRDINIRIEWFKLIIKASVFATTNPIRNLMAQTSTSTLGLIQQDIYVAITFSEVVSLESLDL
jgi:hypothetical protein